MSSSLFDTAFAAVLIGHMLARYSVSLVVRRLRDEHDALWTEMGRPGVLHQLLGLAVNWRLTRFIWTNAASGTQDGTLVALVWIIRGLNVIVLASIVAVLSNVFAIFR